MLVDETTNDCWVASFTDAWIETLISDILKYQSPVASFTDAWIETPLYRWTKTHPVSHLLQMRGLKPISDNSTIFPYESHLLQMRGLKQVRRVGQMQGIVASFTDAWIETFTSCLDMLPILSHLLQMRGLKLFTFEAVN